MATLSSDFTDVYNRGGRDSKVVNLFSLFCCVYAPSGGWKERKQPQPEGKRPAPQVSSSVVYSTNSRPDLASSGRLAFLLGPSEGKS
jgi:hypothetical protein